MHQFLSKARVFTISSYVRNSIRSFSFLTDEEFLLTSKDLKAELFSEIIQPDNPHFLKVAILGEPNVGKSSLINCLMPINVFPTSHVIHTTYKKSTGIMTHGNVQVAFLDTPGIVTIREARNKNVERTVLSDPLASIQEADLLLVLFDIANKYNVMSLHPVIVKYLRSYDIPAILVLNKMDKIKHQINVLQKLESIVKSYQLSGTDKENTAEVATNQNPPRRFKDTFFASSYTGQGIIPLKEYLLNAATPGLWQYPSGVTNDMSIYGKFTSQWNLQKCGIWGTWGTFPDFCIPTFLLRYAPLDVH